jgi:hypothetical protein
MNDAGASMREADLRAAAETVGLDSDRLSAAAEALGV